VGSLQAADFSLETELGEFVFEWDYLDDYFTAVQSIAAPIYTGLSAFVDGKTGVDAIAGESFNFNS